ncbi:MAG: hypothetical protein PUB23_01720, partial [Bacilli bacterium]|nr:hypothetical protein [Bacilli bacterium]
ADVQRTKLTTSSLGIGEEEVEVEKVVDKITWVSHNINDSKGDFKINKGDYIYNKTATPTAIKQVMLNYNSNNHANENLFKVTFSTEANRAGTKEEVFISTAEGVTSYVAAPSANSEFKFVTIAYAYDDYNNYINNIAVDYTKPVQTVETLKKNVSIEDASTHALKYKSDTDKPTAANPDATATEFTQEDIKYAARNIRAANYHYNDPNYNYFYFYKTNDCVLYNVDAYAKDIVSVTVTFPYGGSQDGTLNCAFGTQAITAPTAGQTTLSKTGEYKFVAPEGCKYFALSTFAQSKNVQVTSIVIEYLK